MFMAFVLLLTLAADPAVTIIASGPASGVGEARQVTARTDSEWAALWTSHAGESSRPAVDFSTGMVAAVFLGTRPTSGFAVEVLGAHTEDGTLVIEYVERRPGRGGLVGQVLTSPFQIVRLPRHEGEVRFQKQ